MRVWRLCSILRKDGITYQQYVTELTYLLFLKMMKEMGAERELPATARWSYLMDVTAPGRLSAYKAALSALGTSNRAKSGISPIFEQATTLFRDGSNLVRLMQGIDAIHWSSDERDSFGDLYEGILQKNAEETKRGAGQYFTPRVLIEVMVSLLSPQPNDIVQDPAAGTGGFLVAAYGRAKENGGGCRVTGIETVQDTYRLLLMNLRLHDIPSLEVFHGDTLSHDYEKLPAATVILTNPPFGPAGGPPARDDLTATSGVTSFALPFVEHCVRALQSDGRAAIVVPDNVLYEGGRGRALRRLILDTCDLHTVLKLPSGIFYAAGVKTNVIFLEKKSSGTPGIWFYDLRAGMPSFGRNRPLTSSHFTQFVEFYRRTKAVSQAARITDDPRGRWYTREEIGGRNDDLDVSWLGEDDTSVEDGFSDPEDMVAAVADHLSDALERVQALKSELEALPSSGT
jgi:type I restriction enzyme M protein